MTGRYSALEWLGLCPKPRSLSLWPEGFFYILWAGARNSRPIPVRTGARFALQRGPILRPAVRSVSLYAPSVPYGPDDRVSSRVDRGSALI